MVLADNPWRDTPYGKKGYYLRNPVPWDLRKQGHRAFSEKQKRVTETFATVAREASAACPKTGRMSTNICRIEYIAKHLRGKKY